MAVPFQCAQFALNTAGATQDFTIAGETRTPVAAYFHAVGVTAVDTYTSPRQSSIGATDGTNEWYGAYFSEDNAAASNCFTRKYTDAVIVFMDSAGAIDGQLSFNSFIAGGVRLDHDNNPAAAYLVNIYLFFEGEYAVGTASTGSTADVATNVTGLGFDPTFLLPHEFGLTGFGTSAASEGALSIGYVADNATSGTLQAGFIFREVDAADPTQCEGITSASMGTGFLTAVTSWTQYDFITDGFSATPRIQSNAHSIGYLAGRIEGVNQWAGHIVPPASTTGSHTFTEPGFEACFGLFCMNGVGVVLTTGGAAGGNGIGMFTQEDQISAAGVTEDNQATTDTAGIASVANLVRYAFTVGTDAMVAQWVGTAANGFTINISDDNPVARLWPALVWSAFPVYASVDETLGLVEEVGAPVGGVGIDETLGLTEEVLGAGYAVLDETLGLLEEVHGVGGVAVDETLGLTEEVVSFQAFAPDPTSPAGEGGFARVEEGEGGFAAAVIGG